MGKKREGVERESEERKVEKRKEAVKSGERDRERECDEKQR